MSVHRMDFLVDQHLMQLTREAAEERFGREARRTRRPGTRDAGRWTVPSLQHLLRIVAHDLVTQHVHTHHVHVQPAGHHA